MRRDSRNPGRERSSISGRDRLLREVVAQELALCFADVAFRFPVELETAGFLGVVPGA